MSRARERDGQALAELAIFAPVMLLFMLLAVDFGRLFFDFVSVNNAAREATNYAAIHASDSDYDATTYDAAIVATAQQETNVQAQGGSGAMTVSAPFCYAPASPSIALPCDTAADFATGTGNRVRVTVTVPFTFITPLIGDVFGGSLALTADSTAAILNPLDATILPDPSASPSPSPSPSPDPSATPTPSPPTDCTVPDFKNTFFNNPDALNTWHNVASFTGTLTDASNGNKIKNQTIAKNTVMPCTSNMTVSD